MHEQSLMNDLMHQIEAIAQGKPVLSVKVRLGALSHISAEHFRGHFQQAIEGTCAQGSELDIVESSDLYHPQAQDIILESIDVND